MVKDSFVGDAKGQPSRESDIEMGTRVPGNNPDMGMAAFNKKVYPTHDALFSFAELIWTKNPIDHVEFCRVFSETYTD